MVPRRQLELCSCLPPNEPRREGADPQNSGSLKCTGNVTNNRGGQGCVFVVSLWVCMYVEVLPLLRDPMPQPTWRYDTRHVAGRALKGRCDKSVALPVLRVAAVFYRSSDHFADSSMILHACGQTVNTPLLYNPNCFRVRSLASSRRVGRARFVTHNIERTFTIGIAQQPERIL